MTPKRIENSTIKLIKINKLKFDTANTRFAHITKNHKSISQQKAFSILVEIGEITELVREIIEAEQIYEEIVITHNHIVIEGNRRLAALRYIVNGIEKGKYPQLNKKSFDHIKCKIIPKDVKQSEIDIYLATLHVRAKKPWRLFNRASFVYQLHKVHHFSYNKIAAHVGMSKETVQRSMVCYNLVLDYSNLYPKDEGWSTKYSYFEELFKKKSLVEFRNNKHNIKKFHKWIHNGLLISYQTRKLSEIIMNSSAFTEFEKNGIDSALKVLIKEDPENYDPGFKHIKNTISTIKNLTRTELSELKKDRNKMRSLFNLKNEIEILLSELESVKIKFIH